MIRVFPKLTLIVLPLLWLSYPLTAKELSLQALEQRVMQVDANLSALKYQAQALREKAAVAGELPDPRLFLAARNIPLDTFDFNQEPMTQAVIGIRQSFPAGESLQKQSDLADINAQEANVRVNRTSLQLLRQVREQWLAIYQARGQLEFLAKKSELMEERQKTLEASYQSGRITKQQVTAKALELLTINDRKHYFQGIIQEKTAALGLWLDASDTLATVKTLPEVFKNLPAIDLNQEHPELLALSLAEQKATAQLGLQQQQYKPGWALETSYGWRDGRADFLSVGVNLDLRLFQKKKKDPLIDAAHSNITASAKKSANKKAEFDSHLKSIHASAKILQRRILLYQDEVIPKRREHSEFARIDYESGRAGLIAYYAAQIEVINSQQQLFDLEVALAKEIIAALYFQAGEA